MRGPAHNPPRDGLRNPFGSALLALTACLVCAPSAGAEGLDAERLVELRRLAEPVLSPDATHVAFSLRETDRESGRVQRDIWLLALSPAGQQPRRLTTHPGNDSQPIWAPDGGQIYFLSDRGGTNQVWRLPLDFGEPVPVTELPVPVTTFRLAPDGETLAFTATLHPGCAADMECAAARIEERRARRDSARVYDALMVRHWDRWLDEDLSALFTLPLDAGGDAAAERPTLVSGDLAADIPTRPFGDASGYVFTTDARRLIFSAKPRSRAEAWTTNSDLFEARVRGGRLRNLTEGNPAADTRPIVSPDGRDLVYLAASRPGYESDRRRMMIRDLRTGRTREIAPGWDRSPEEIAFSADGRELYAVAADQGRRLLFRIDVETGTVLPLTAGGSVGSLNVAPGFLLFRRNSLSAPADIHRLDLATLSLDRITDVNADLLAGVRMGEFEQFSFPGWNEEPVYGYVMKPADFEPGRRYPVAFLIHGGPQGSFADRFHYRWNPQVYADAGFASVFIDFHGSVGYGQGFTDSIRGDWGGKPLEDLQRGLGAALSRFDWLDSERICALGASYGGYMVNWIAGNWPERFRCLVNHDGLFDLRMMYFTTEELWFPEWEFGGPWFDNAAAYEKHNPVYHVTKWQTPMLVIHGALDFRVPETQALATFTALQRRGIDSRLVYFPDENHWVLNPDNSVRWHREVLAWLERHLDR